MLSLRPAVAVAAVALTAAAIGACGDDEEASSTGAEASAKLTGPPIKLGVAFVESGPLADQDFFAGVKATVEHINTDLSGVGGRPIEMVACGSENNAETSARCANEIVRQKPMAVVAGQDSGAAASVPIYRRAQLPYVTYATNTLTDPGAVVLAAGFPGYGAAATKFATRDLDAGRVAMVHTDLVPQQVIDNFFRKPLEGQGAQVRTVPFSADAADITPAVQAAREFNPEVVILAAPGEGPCVQLLRSAKQLIPDARFIDLRCGEKQILSKVGDAAEGMYFVSSNDVGTGAPATPDTREYADYIERYGDGVSPEGEARWGALVTMTLYRAMNDVRDGLSALRLQRRLRDSRGGQVFLGDDYRCGQLPVFPSLCVTEVRLFQVSNGQPKAVNGWYSGIDVLALR
jgi:branched-chain amino acid transport system substrate-binding protein